MAAETFPDFWNNFGNRWIETGDSPETVAQAAWHAGQCALLNQQEEDAKSNAMLKVTPVMSADCEDGDHASCEGEESALWPDGTFSMRKCSCACHAAVNHAA